MTDRDFESVVQLARGSIVWQVMRWAGDACQAAWTSSSAVGMTRSAWSSIASWPDEVRLRAAALTVTWAGIGYAASLFVLPRYVVSGLPPVWVGSLVLASLIVAAFPAAFVAAWKERQ